ncbi:MAG: HD domain-containing protein [Patescibacteria group bacterium]|nr:HD domain-containing protein [Patescibacteria group bacterium]MDD4610458.1 HD domain-containing protein [Patescibacteria group bacterium]
MTEKQFKQITTDIETLILKNAKKNDWLWFYDMHQKEVVRCAEELLKMYKADKQIVIVACWLHDISKYQVKNKLDTKKAHATHHFDSYEFSKKFLAKYKISQVEKDKICNCVLRHRNEAPYRARSTEEKIVAVADTLSHFTGIFYFTHFKFHPESSMDFMVKNQLEKLNRDWRDLNLLSKARKLVREEFIILKKLHENYLIK